MKNISGSKSDKAKKSNDSGTKRKAKSARSKSAVGPVEYEEDRSMNIRMKEQPLRSSASPENDDKKQ